MRVRDSTEQALPVPQSAPAPSAKVGVRLFLAEPPAQDRVVRQVQRLMDRSPSRLRNAGGFVTSGSSMSPPSDSQYGNRDSMVRSSTRAADHARDQVQSALDGLLNDGDISNRSPPSRGYDPVDNARSPAPSPGGRRRSYTPAEPISIEAASPQRYQSPTDLPSSGRKSSALTLDSGGYTPTAAGGRR